MTESVDPFRYGYPPPQPSPTGQQVVNASAEMLRADRQLIWLPVLSSLVGVVAGAVLFLPGFAVGRSVGHTNEIGGYVGGALAAFALSVVSIYFQAALVIGAFMRADGLEPTLDAVLRAAWVRRRQIFGWAVVTTTAGTALRVVEERLGIVGKLLGLVVGIGWAIASFFVVPVVVAEGLGPIAGMKRSVRLIRETWGSSVRTSVRLGVAYTLAFLPLVVVFIVGLALAWEGSVVAGVVVMIVVAAAALVLGSLYAAVTTYARALLYRYAVGLPVPGLPPAFLANAFTAKRRRWWNRS